jgi:cyclopropane-fatty-acyl-phospholipid synthase
MSDRFSRKLASTPVPIELRLPDGRAQRFGVAEPVLEVIVENDRGLAAVHSLKELEIVEAYMRGDLDFEGDLMAAMDIRDVLSDAQPLTRAWTLVQPALFGRKRLNPRWIAQHYDSENMQLFAVDTEWQVYTPGIYTSEDDSLEEGAERKLAYAFDSLGLKPGDTVLDVGFGWGGFLRYCAQRGVSATGISLSRHQLEFAGERLRQEGLEAELLYQDFFTYEPGRQFHGITLMGSIEDLSNYGKVLERLKTWLLPGARVYMDFAAVDRPWGVPSFVTKYVWPGAFRMVYMPSLMRALARHHFDVLEMQNDRRNYHLWTRGGYERWLQRKDEVIEAAGEQTWRMMRLLMAGVSHMTSDRSIRATAYRMVLEPRYKLPGPWRSSPGPWQARSSPSRVAEEASAAPRREP